MLIFSNGLLCLADAGNPDRANMLSQAKLTFPQIKRNFSQEVGISECIEPKESPSPMLDDSCTDDDSGTDDDAGEEDKINWKSSDQFNAELRQAVMQLRCQGYTTFKSGSAFLDRSSRRTGDQAQYPREDFVNADAIIVKVLFETDADGGRRETVANKLPMAVNVRKEEANGFARKPGDRKFSKADPGIVYLVPTRYATKADLKKNHLSRYMKLKLKVWHVCIKDG